MPEYLSPGVYVEEVASGNQPIEGVSTSTSGLVGVTERGPVNVPMLVTSFGEYRRTFGGYLDITDFTDPTGRAHSYTPHALEGFFLNGGKRAWVTRALPEDAERAERRLFFADPLVTGYQDTVLLRAAEENTGTAVNGPPLYLLDATNVKNGDVLRVGDGSRAEYRAVNAIGAATHVALALGLQGSHAVSVKARDVVRTVDTPAYTTADFKLAAAGAVGATTIRVKAGTTAGDVAKLLATLGGATQLLEVGAGDLAEYIMASGVTDLGSNQLLVTLATALQRDHGLDAAVTALKVPAGADQQLTTAANGGDLLVNLDGLGGLFTNPAHLIVLDPGNPDQEVRRIGQLDLIAVDPAAYDAYPAGAYVEKVTLADDDLVAAAGSTTTVLQVASTKNAVAGMALTFSGVTRVIKSVDSTTKITMATAFGAAPVAGNAITGQRRTLTAAAGAGAVVLQLDNRLGLAAGDVLRVGAGTTAEYVTIRSVAEPRNVPPDAGAVILAAPLQGAHALAEAVRRQDPPPASTAQATPLVLGASARAEELLVSDGHGFATGDVVRVTTPAGSQFFHTLAGNTAAAPLPVTLDQALLRSHMAGSTAAARQPLLAVRALDPGAWGNRVLVSALDETKGMLARAEVTAVTPSPGPGLPSTLRLTTVTGVEAGTVLQLQDPTGATQAGATLLKVKSVSRAANNLVTLDAPGLQPDHIAAFAAAAALGQRLVARSRELRLDVLLLQPPNPAVPSRNDDLLDGESFRQLSMDPRHSRYFERILGSTFADGAATDDLGRPLRRSDHRSEGGSQYVRVRDLGSDQADRERVRLGPEALVDVLPSGLTRAARLRLGEAEDAAIAGNDSVATMDDAMYIGVDSDEPAHRTGIHALKNVQDLSLVAAPGQTTPAVQQALIDHCELMRYRFAVLDAQGPTLGDTIADVEAQRQQFDSRYAAFYHPWVTIPDPFPDSLSTIPQLPVPPSGHVLGIYARSDNERGVHKAPANEVVRGISGLARYLNKGEQDVLNAYPVNIDVIRDFRGANRGIRVWGARCITSDSSFKYVNVRRLLIFLEDSIDRGLQWVVFEPNAEELWARVRRSVTNFLTTVWRNGALEGTTKEQAFFVKCDRTTMTQDDIDNGRLICLIGVAPVKPAEFVIIRIGLFTAEATS